MAMQTEGRQLAQVSALDLWLVGLHSAFAAHYKKE